MGAEEEAEGRQEGLIGYECGLLDEAGVRIIVSRLCSWEVC